MLSPGVALCALGGPCVAQCFPGKKMYLSDPWTTAAVALLAWIFEPPVNSTTRYVFGRKQQILGALSCTRKTLLGSHRCSMLLLWIFETVV